MENFPKRKGLTIYHVVVVINSVGVSLRSVRIQTYSCQDLYGFNLNWFKIVYLCNGFRLNFAIMS